MPFLRRRRLAGPTGTTTSTPRPSGTGSRYPANAQSLNRYRIATVTDRQWGVASWAQLRRRGLAKAALTRAIAAGRLHPVFPGVYSAISLALLSAEGRHAAAVLCGGDGARLCGPSAAWWVKVRRDRPSSIHVAVRGRRRPVAGIRWHRLDLGGEEAVKYERMPITALARIPLDLAGELSEWDLRGVLAELEYRHGITPDAVREHLRPKPGVARLRRALEAHTPQLAETRSHLERAFARFLDECGFEMCAFSSPLGKSTVDAVYAEARIAIELDGVRGHSGERRILRDHRRDLHRRADGFIPLRYHYAQVMHPEDRRLIEAELDRYGAPRRAGTGL